jgi:L-arabinokinase
VIAAYVSGHGFGHATRTGEVLRALRRARPDLPLAVVTSAPDRLFARALGGPFLYRRVPCDVGLAQRGALQIDLPETARRWREFAAGYDALAAAEARWLRGSGVRAVLADIPPLAFDAAAEAGVPAVGLANFSWDWIYAHYAGQEPVLSEAAAQAARAYAQAHLLLELPFAGDLGAFPRRRRIPLVARRPRVAAEDARQRLGLRGDRPLVLVSFGGFGVDLDRAALDTAPGLAVVHSDDLAPRLEALGLGYEDLVGGVDVVLTKPGYGIVSDVIGARRRLVYTERGDFPEYPILVEAMARLVPVAYVSNDDLGAGRIAPAVRRVLDRPMPPPADLSGADAAARAVLELAGEPPQ